jgi:uncharacterized protein YjbI with pentapeptide repeats
MTTDAEDRSAWPWNEKPIRRRELLRLIEENGGLKGLDLRGAVFVGDAPGDVPYYNPIDLSPAALAPLAEAHRRANDGCDPLWLAPGGAIVLWGAWLQRANLRRAQLQGAVLMTAQLQGAHLMSAQLQGADLMGTQLQGAHLSDAQLQGAHLTSAQLQGADLWGTQLQGASLMSAQLQHLDLYWVGSLDRARWFGADLDRTRIRRESLGKATGDELLAHFEKRTEAYHGAKEAYLLLKNNFNQIGRYEDASWAYVKEQQMEKMAYHWEWRSHGWKVWRAWGPFWRWLRNWAYELATGYGERPWNPVIGGGLIILGFAGAFCATRAIANFWDALVYSIATFATFNLADTGPTGRAADLASSVEALLGIAVLALVIFTLGNKMSRG